MWDGLINCFIPLAVFSLSAYMEKGVETSKVKLLSLPWTTATTSCLFC